MKIELWAKKIGQNGHMFFNVIDVPDGTYEWKIPVREVISVRAAPTETPTSSFPAVRVFRMRHPYWERVLNAPPKFFEE